VLLGTLIGVLPGIGPVPTIAMLLPITYALPPVSALIMLAGIYYGAQYGGSTTAILVNLAGRVVLGRHLHRRLPDGAARQGGKALSVAAIGSFIAGTVATVVVAAFAPPLAEFALKFGPAEYFSLMVLGLLAAVVLASGSLLKAIAMIVLGLLLGIIGTDVNSGCSATRSACRSSPTASASSSSRWGSSASPRSSSTSSTASTARCSPTTSPGCGSSGPSSRKRCRRCCAAPSIGSVLGILPGGGAMLSAFAAYTLEKKIAKDPSRFGKGAIEGVAGPRARTTRARRPRSFPLLTLGIPPNAVMALMVGAMTIHSIQPARR
jgi:TctA family transporter